MHSYVDATIDEIVELFRVKLQTLLGSQLYKIARELPQVDK